MEETKPKLPNLGLTTLLIVVALGVVVGVALFQAKGRGLLNIGTLPVPKIEIQETRTIVHEENAVISVVEKSSPSVVAIGVSRKIINLFDPFAVPSQQDSTIGTGFVVSDKGIIVTNKHVVSQNGTYTVVVGENRKYEVKKIYRDPILDLALVQIDATDLKPLDLGDSSKLKVGQTVIAIGNALGKFTNTVTTGVVSGLGRKVIVGDNFGGAQESLDNLIQTDAAINPGNSGGPLLNSVGQVIGVNVATTQGAQNIGFAIPINSVKAIVDEFVSKGAISRPFLGVRYRFIAKDVAILNEIPQGAFIQEVVVNGPADKVGIKVRDILTKINGQAIDSESKIGDIVSKAQIGQKIDLEIWRAGKTQKITAILEDLPAE